MGMDSTAIVLLCVVSFQLLSGKIIDVSFGEDDDYTRTSVQSDSAGSSEFLDDSTVSRLFLRPQCSIGEYLHELRCRPCSACAPDFYTRRYCQPTTDAVCEWCSVSNPSRNMDFWLKCQRAVKVNAGVSFFDAVPEGARVEVLTPVSTSVVRIPVQLQESAKWSWKMELIFESLLYLAVIALLFVAFRLATRSKPYYRSVTITAPVFDECDKSNIRLAASYLQQKLGQRRYEDLEEFV